MCYLKFTVIVCLLSVCGLLSGVFSDPSISPSDINVDKTHDGLSTASDTVIQESKTISIDGFSSEEMSLLRQKSQEFQFQAEVNRMMKLIINSLYKNKEIFLRELISNASDALDKIRLQSLTDSEALSATPELSIRIKANKEARTMHIIDTGIGMSKEELMSNLGTIAKSGTSEFLEKLSSSQSVSETTDLIGQFGVGFYSAFLVSDKVVVITHKNGNAQYVWESDSESFSIAEDPRQDILKRGTEVILYLKEEAADFLEPERLNTIVKKYSQFINFPIYLWSSRVEKVTDDVTTEDKEKAGDEEVIVEDEKKDATKTVEKTVWDWVHVNENKPIWRRKADEITEEEYTTLYRALSLDHDEPFTKVHFKGEGTISFTAILYIPKRSHGDLFSETYRYKERIKLHVRHVYVPDTEVELIPKYLGFVVGIVDSDDLPLNVSRETLQQTQLVTSARKKNVHKILEAIKQISEKSYPDFWKEYGVHLKLGMITDHSNRGKLSKLLRYYTSKSGDKMASLSEYVSRMKPGQEAIFYLTGSSLDEVKSSPLGERLIKKGYEVIYMIDSIDTFVMQSFNEFDKKTLQNVAKEGVKLETTDESKARQESQQKEFENLLKWFKDKALSGKIEKAELSERLSDSPAILVATKYGWSGDMERIMRAQAQHRGDDSSSSYYSQMPKILEINPRHPLIKELNRRVKTDSSDKEAMDTAELLLYIASLRSGYTIQNSENFAQKVEFLLRKNLGVDVFEQTEVEPDEPDLSDTNSSESVTDEELGETVSKADNGPSHEPELVEDDTQVDRGTVPKDEL